MPRRGGPGRLCAGPHAPIVEDVAEPFGGCKRGGTLLRCWNLKPALPRLRLARQVSAGLAMGFSYIRKTL